MNHQAEELNCWRTTGSPNRGGDEVPDNRQIPENPVGAVFARAAFVACGGPPEAFDGSTTASGGLSKRSGLEAAIANRLGISGPYGSAATLAKSARTETTVAPNGDRWESVIAANGELISARVTNTDGGSLEKRDADIDFSDIEADAKIFAQRLAKEWGVEDAA